MLLKKFALLNRNITMNNTIFYPKLTKTITTVLQKEIAKERKKQLQLLINYIQTKITNKKPVQLNFICTHNSRRSQLAQIWAQTAATYYHVNANCKSGGIVTTAFNKQAVAAIKKAGFKILKEEKSNPIYTIYYAAQTPPIITFSKLYNDESSFKNNFAAIMTCTNADENCPFIAGVEQRIAICYNDPKEFDGTNLSTIKYNECSMLIATEMFYVFSQIKF